MKGTEMARITGKKQEKTEIEGKESWRDLTITKVCDTCGKEYHPRRNGYELISRYCSQRCSRLGIKKRLH